MTTRARKTWSRKRSSVGSRRCSRGGPGRDPQRPTTCTRLAPCSKVHHPNLFYGPPLMALYRNQGQPPSPSDTQEKRPHQKAIGQRSKNDQGRSFLLANPKRNVPPLLRQAHSHQPTTQQAQTPEKHRPLPLSSNSLTCAISFARASLTKVLSAAKNQNSISAMTDRVGLVHRLRIV